MAENYLGESPVDLTNSPYRDFGPAEWAMEFVGRYGQIQGDHHRAWVLDQVSRILKGTPVTVVLARWKSGAEEYRITTAEPSAAYLAWVEDMKGATDEYGYDEGIAP